MALHHMTRCGFVITDVHHRRVLPCGRAVHEVQAGGGDVVDMHSAEHLAWFLNRFQGAGLHRGERGTPRSVDSR